MNIRKYDDNSHKDDLKPRHKLSASQARSYALKKFGSVKANGLEWAAGWLFLDTDGN